MNPNPYRTTLLVFASIGLGLGGLFLIVGAASAASGDYSTLGLAAIGGYLFAGGFSFFVLWLLASAIIHGITVTPQLAAAGPAAPDPDRSTSATQAAAEPGRAMTAAEVQAAYRRSAEASRNSPTG